MNSATHLKKTALRSAILIALGVNGAALTLSAGDVQADNQACANSVSTDSGNFTMLDPYGYVVGGTNDVLMSWDGTAFTSSSDYIGPGSVANVTMSSTTAFFSNTWTAHDIQVFAPGSYSFDTALGGGNAESGIMTMNVGAGQIGMHMLFDWNNNFNIDVVVVADQNKVFGSGKGNTANPGCNSGSGKTPNGVNCLYDGGAYGSAGMPNAANPWMLASGDADADTVMGTPMAPGGPFQYFNANFNFNFSTALTLTSGTVCNPATVVHTFDFTDLTGKDINTTYQSPNTVTVAFDSGTGPAPVTISGGQYSKNGGAYTSADGTAVAGDQFTVQLTTGPNYDGTTSNASLNIGGTIGVFSVTVIDKKPAAFTFTDQTGVPTSTLVESNTITVSGMDTGRTTPINVSGGEYSINGGAYTSVAGTVQNGDSVKVRQLSAATGATSTIATLTLGQVSDGTLVSGTFTVRTAGGITMSNENFTMLDPSGGVTGGTNDVNMDWDQQLNSSTSDPVTPATAHMHLSSGTPFFQYVWTAHHIRVFGPGTYTINVDCTTTQLETGTCTANSDPSKNYTFTVGANQIGAHMLFDWNTAKNIDVVDIWNQSAVFGPSQLYTGGTGCANPAQVWDLMSTDWDGDGQNGAKMIDGPFAGFSANFNLRTTTTALPCSTTYTPTVTVADPSNAPGCSISSTPVSALKRADWWLVGGFLAWLGGIRFRAKRRQAKS
jgi:hypothetical protein